MLRSQPWIIGLGTSPGAHLVPSRLRMVVNQGVGSGMALKLPTDVSLRRALDAARRFLGGFDIPFESSSPVRPACIPQMSPCWRSAGYAPSDLAVPTIDL